MHVHSVVPIAIDIDCFHNHHPNHIKQREPLLSDKLTQKNYANYEFVFIFLNAFYHRQQTKIHLVFVPLQSNLNMEIYICRCSRIRSAGILFYVQPQFLSRSSACYALHKLLNHEYLCDWNPGSTASPRIRSKAHPKLWCECVFVCELPSFHARVKCRSEHCTSGSKVAPQSSTLSPVCRLKVIAWRTGCFEGV